MAKKKEVAVFRWGPDFRCAEALPDIKTVRTSFFLNAVTLTTAIMGLMYIVFQHTDLTSMEEGVESRSQKIESLKPDHNATLKLNTGFKEKAAYLDEVSLFMSDQMVGSDLFIDLGESLVQGMSLTEVSYKRERIMLKGRVASGMEADALLNAYLKSVQLKPSIKQFYNLFQQISVVRNSESGDMEFVLEFSDSSLAGKKS